MPNPLRLRRPPLGFRGGRQADAFDPFADKSQRFVQVYPA